ncbi:MAG: DUF4440 domain-containing protein [Gammaproteobacteria bacterium]|nr:DUF4440 domain-containing protein [Gammaproteobacteria bacterium]
MQRPVYTTPEAAEAAFYEAFQRADLEAMMAVWADDETIVCVHPMGPRVQGRAAVTESWRRIFANSGAMRFEIADAHSVHDSQLSIHCVHEDIDFGAQLRQHSRVIATNVYRLTADGWRMILHHASPGATQRAARERPRALH